MKLPINRLLTNRDREHYESTIDEMFYLSPNMMGRKIPEANVQQAFVFDIVKKYPKARKLAVGCFEDTIYDCLIKAGEKPFGIDPAINFDLHTFKLNAKVQYDMIFACSVIEHVVDDEEFIADLCSLLNCDGTAILTMDYNNSYVPGNPVPNTVVRQYTKYDLEVRLPKILEKNGCKLIGNPNWEGENDFFYQGHTYSFATFVFRRICK